MSISQMLLPEFDREMANTRKLLSCVPEDKFSWQPHAKSMTLGRLASHVAELPNWAVETINRETLELQRGMKPWSATSQAELLERFDKNVAEARAAIAGASDADLAVDWSRIFGGHKVMTMPRVAVLRSVVMNHLIHHRAQLGVYLRLNDVPIPGMYGPSADESNMFGSAGA
jgi:uncharacterized damage-inducible protein DinB